MSLINKVLLDLDNRTQGGAVTANQSLFSDLQPVGAPSTGALLRWIWIVISGVVIIATLTGGWYYLQGIRKLPSESVSKQAVSPVGKVQQVVTSPEVVSDPPSAPVPHDNVDKNVPAAPDTKPEDTKRVTSNENVAPQKPVPAVELPVKPKTNQNAPSTAVSVSKPEVDSSLERKLRPLNPEERAERLYLKGLSLIRSGQEREGENALRAALAINPTHIEARETLSVVLLQEHNFEQAKHVLSEGIEIAPDYAPFSSRLARLYIEQGDEARALDLLENNRARVKPDAEYLGMLGTLYQRAAKQADARDAFRQALSMQPDEGRWWMGLGISLEALRDWTAARDAYQRCLMSAHIDPRVHQYAEQRLSIVGRYIK